MRAWPDQMQLFGGAVTDRRRQRSVAGCGLSVALLLSGCASTGTPKAPSLMLPQIVRGAQLERYGNHVDLRWTTPTLSTDRQPLVRRKHGAGTITAEICRVQGKACTVFSRQVVTPGASAVATDPLDAALTMGPPRPLRYRIQLLNGAGRSAGWSRDLITAAGEAPAAMAGLTANTVNRGVQLTWRPAPAIPGERIVLQAEPMGENAAASRELAVPGDAPGAIDTVPKPGDVVRYTVVRTRPVQIDGATLTMHGDAATVQATVQKDTFAPAPPHGLMAVAVQMQGSAPEIDLSWEPNTEPDLLGYVVYRTDLSTADATPVRLNAEPVQTVNYRDMAAQPSHAYRYAVAAVDRSGNESKPSAAAQESLH